MVKCSKHCFKNKRWIRLWCDAKINWLSTETCLLECKLLAKLNFLHKFFRCEFSVWFLLNLWPQKYCLKIIFSLDHFYKIYIWCILLVFFLLLPLLVAIYMRCKILQYIVPNCFIVTNFLIWVYTVQLGILSHSSEIVWDWTITAKASNPLN